MKQAQIALAARIARGWVFPAVPSVALAFRGSMTNEEVLRAVERIYARFANN